MNIGNQKSAADIPDYTPSALFMLSQGSGLMNTLPASEEIRREVTREVYETSPGMDVSTLKSLYDLTAGQSQSSSLDKLSKPLQIAEASNSLSALGKAVSHSVTDLADKAREFADSLIKPEVSPSLDLEHGGRRPVLGFAGIRG